MLRIVSLALALLALVAVPAAADDGPTHFRRTTPRAFLEELDGTLSLGVPAGRAWGIESELRPLTPDAALAIRLGVGDDGVREAFARVAYYARPTGRSRQIAIQDTELVAAGEGRILYLPLEPPPGAVAYRVRVLARLRAPAPRSREDAIHARIVPIDRAAIRSGPLLSRLLPDGP